MPNRDDQMRDAAQAFMLVLNFIGTILLFTAAGWGLDWWRGTSPIFTLIGVGVGFGGGVFGFFKAATRLGKAKQREIESRGRPGPAGDDGDGRKTR